MVYVLNERKEVDLDMKPKFIALFAFMFAVSIGALWEIFEYGYGSGIWSEYAEKWFAGHHVGSDRGCGRRSVYLNTGMGLYQQSGRKTLFLSAGFVILSRKIRACSRMARLEKSKVRKTELKEKKFKYY